VGCGRLSYEDDEVNPLVVKKQLQVASMKNHPLELSPRGSGCKNLDLRQPRSQELAKICNFLLSPEKKLS
jgi:hypothetical protein